MELWQEMLRASVDSGKDLVERFNFDKDLADKLNSLFHIRINRYYLSLIRYPGDPIWLQCIPDAQEFVPDDFPLDPLNEEADSPVPSITHRYPDRVLFLTTSQCSMYCRFCTRKRKVGDSGKISMKFIQSGLDYIAAHPEVRDIILSGGDPLMLTDVMLEKIISGLRAIPHVEIIRLGTKMPCVLPQRITPKLCKMLKKYHPIYVNTHFNHPWECTTEAKRACEMLADAGIPVGNQAVLMKGVNDDPDVMLELMRKLLMMRVRPYYLYQADITKGANHFRTPVSVGLNIMDKLRGHTSGTCDPALRDRCAGRRRENSLASAVCPRQKRQQHYSAKLQIRHLPISRCRRRREKARGTARKTLHAQTNKADAKKSVRNPADARRGFGRNKV